MNQEQQRIAELEQRKKFLEALKAYRMELVNKEGVDQNKQTAPVRSGPVKTYAKKGIAARMYDKDTNGFINILMLSLFTLFFECLFLFISFFIFR